MDAQFSGDRRLIWLSVAAQLLVHDWYPKQCCSDRDCHQVPCAEISVSGDYYLWHRIMFFRRSAQMSPDGLCHVCVSETKNGVCIFLGGTS